MVPGMTRSPKSIAGVVNQYGAQNPEGNVAANAAEFGASSASQTALQKNLDVATAFSHKADLDAQRLNAVMQHVPNLGTTFLNRPVRSLTGALGSEAIAELGAIRLGVAREYTRLVENPNLTGVVTQESKQAMDDVLKADYTPGQIAAALRQLRLEGGNRMSTYGDQLRTINSRIRGIGKGEVGAASRDLGADWGNR